MKKVGVFAGTFDPLHNGHLAFARQALRSGLDKVYFLPEPRPRRKQGVRALEHRQGMIEVAIQDDTKLGLIKLEQARFTPYETLPVLQQRFPNAEIVLLFGDDVLRHIADWPRITELVDSVELLIATRHDDRVSIDERMQTLAAVQGLNFRHQLVELSEPTSSSAVRAAVRRSDTQAMIPDQVAAYIKQHRLYR